MQVPITGPSKDARCFQKPFDFATFLMVVDSPPGITRCVTPEKSSAILISLWATPEQL
jgi:hypothetical protein